MTCHSQAGLFYTSDNTEEKDNACPLFIFICLGPGEQKEVALKNLAASTMPILKTLTIEPLAKKIIQHSLGKNVLPFSQLLLFKPPKDVCHILLACS